MEAVWLLLAGGEAAALGGLWPLGEVALVVAATELLMVVKAMEGVVAQVAQAWSWQEPEVVAAAVEAVVQQPGQLSLGVVVVAEGPQVWPESCQMWMQLAAAVAEVVVLTLAGSSWEAGVGAVVAPAPLLLLLHACLCLGQQLQSGQQQSGHPCFAGPESQAPAVGAALLVSRQLGRARGRQQDSEQVKLPLCQPTQVGSARPSPYVGQWHGC